MYKIMWEKLDRAVTMHKHKITIPQGQVPAVIKNGPITAGHLTKDIVRMVRNVHLKIVVRIVIMRDMHLSIAAKRKRQESQSYHWVVDKCIFKFKFCL